MAAKPSQREAAYAGPLYGHRFKLDPAWPIDPRPPVDWDAQCDGIENVSGFALSPVARECLWNSIFMYSLRAWNSQAKGLTPREQKAKLELIAGTAATLRELMQEISLNENPVTTWALIGQHWSPSCDWESWLSDLGELSSACRAADHQRFASLARSPGRPSMPGFGDFVREMATIHTFMGGNPSASWSDGADAGVKGPFVRFCVAAHDRAVLPDGAPVPASLGDAIRNELRRGRDTGYDTPMIQQIANHLDRERAG